MSTGDLRVTLPTTGRISPTRPQQTPQAGADSPAENLVLTAFIRAHNAASTLSNQTIDM